MAETDCLSEQQEKINSLLEQCQELASQSRVSIVELSPSGEERSLPSALKSLYRALKNLTNESTGGNDSRTVYDCRQYVAEFLIYKLKRVIISLDEEIEGPFLRDGCTCDWTEFVPSQTEGGREISVCNHQERLIDNCLDFCGYGISLEVSVECLRTVSRACRKSSTEEEEQPSLSAVVTSLRTMRRRLLVDSSMSSAEHVAGVVSASHVQVLAKNDCNHMNMLKYVVLPLEYCKSNQSTDQEFLLSESLASLATTVIPSLVSSACHSMHLPLPLWASAKESHGYMLDSAFRMELAATFLKEQSETTSQHIERMDVICECTADYLQNLMRHIILHRGGNAIISLMNQVWNSAQETCGNNIVEPQSILRSHLEKVLESIPSKREVASFIRALVRFSISQHRSQLSKQCPTHSKTPPELDLICKEKVLPSLEYFLTPTLSREIDLREAVVNFTILSPPTSFKVARTDQHSLHLMDKIVPRCISMLLCSACNSSTGESKFIDSMTLIEHLSTVAAVWCEEIFVSKTAPVQQQYVTEFLLYPLEQQILTQDSIQLGLDDSGASLSSMLIQGISFRLEVSRADSIRRDGMRAAEAVAHIFGQTLSFDELHQEENNSNESKEVVAKSEPKKKTKEKKSKVMRPKPIALLVVDPDAEVFSDESSSESNDSSSESGSEYSNNSDSSWGEDSLEPYRMDDDEEDLCRVPRPRSLRDCVAYLLTNNEDREAFDKHEAALQELPTLISSRPLDLMDVVPTLVRVLLHMEDKFNMDGFSEHRWDSLMACAVEAPVETCFKLVEEMKGHVSLGTRLEALSVIGCSAEELSGTTSLKERRQIKEENSYELTQMSTRLRNSLALSQPSNDSVVQHKTRRWRKIRPTNFSTTNRFNALSAQMILSLFAFLNQTKSDDTIWGGSLGERLLSEFLRTLSKMVECSRTYPASRVFASDLFELAWSFHNAKNSEVRRAVLIAIATSVSVDPIAIGNINTLSGTISFLTDCGSKDVDADCREIALSIVGTLTNAYQHPMLA